MPAKRTIADSAGEILPSQWYGDTKPKDPRFQGPRQLMLAVLTDALRCLQTSARGLKVHQRRSLMEAEAWIADRHAQGPFAFESVCESVGINPERLRETVGEWREQRLSGRPVRHAIKHLPQTHPRPTLPSIARRRRGFKRREVQTRA